MKVVYGIFLLLLTINASGAVIGVTTGNSTVSAVRVEGRWAFVSFDHRAAPTNCPGTRIYLDLYEEYHKVAYSTALAAFMAGKKVALRANDAQPKVFGACMIHDIYVLK